jgi:guanylate kinase
MKRKKQGLMIVLSSPSGGGKTTVAGRLLERDKNLLRSVSCTTRKPRPGERHGRDYFFVSPAKFRALAARGAFLEWAKVHRNRYGTPKAWVEGRLAEGKDVLFVIDVQGGRALKRKVPGSVLVFLEPPSLSVLRRRLLGRGSENLRDLRVRLRDAKRELREGRRYDHRVVNDQLAKAVSDVLKIIRKERVKASCREATKTAKKVLS